MIVYFCKDKIHNNLKRIGVKVKSGTSRSDPSYQLGVRIRAKKKKIGIRLPDRDSTPLPQPQEAMQTLFKSLTNFHVHSREILSKAQAYYSANITNLHSS